jgi:hypothetical protein
VYTLFHTVMLEGKGNSFLQEARLNLTHVTLSYFRTLTHSLTLLHEQEPLEPASDPDIPNGCLTA